MTCQLLDPLFILAALFGIAWFALIFTGLIYGLRAGRGRAAGYQPEPSALSHALPPPKHT